MVLGELSRITLAVAFEWVLPEKPARKPLPGATYDSSGAACHYQDGTFVFVAAEADCPQRSPESGAAFGFWHPDFVTLHLWVWYPNPDGIFAAMDLGLLRPQSRRDPAVRLRGLVLGAAS